MSNEAERLLRGAQPGEVPGGVGLIRLTVSSVNKSQEILEKVREVLRMFLEHDSGSWPSDEDWRESLPSWLVSSSAPEMSSEEADAWLKKWQGLSPEERQRLEEDSPWALGDWLYWFEPDQRQWTWWTASVRDPDTLEVKLEAKEWPQPTAALEWLFRAAGATKIEKDDLG
jgi:hypothetical protein